MPAYRDFSDNRFRHLELIQGKIERFVANQFLVKGWAITVTSFFLGFAVKNGDWLVAIVGLVPIGVFWWFDRYLLETERYFRVLYDRVRSENDDTADQTKHGHEPFFMAAKDLDDLDDDEREKVSSEMVKARPAIRTFYRLLVAGTIVVAIVAAIAKPPPPTTQVVVSAPSTQASPATVGCDTARVLSDTIASDVSIVRLMTRALARQDPATVHKVRDLMQRIGDLAQRGDGLVASCS